MPLQSIFISDSEKINIEINLEFNTSIIEFDTVFGERMFLSPKLLVFSLSAVWDLG